MLARLSCFLQPAAEVLQQVVIAMAFLCEVNWCACSGLARQPYAELVGRGGYASAPSPYRHSVLSPALRNRNRPAEKPGNRRPSPQKSFIACVFSYS